MFRKSRNGSRDPEWSLLYQARLNSDISVLVTRTSLSHFTFIIINIVSAIQTSQKRGREETICIRPSLHHHFTTRGHLGNPDNHIIIILWTSWSSGATPSPTPTPSPSSTSTLYIFSGISANPSGLASVRSLKQREYLSSS